MHEKRKLVQEEAEISRKVASAKDYVKRLIIHHDPLKQAIVSAVRTSEGIDKPVVAGLIDHSSLRFKPAMIISDAGKNIVTAVSLEKLLSANNKTLYENGIPELPFDLITNPQWLYVLRYSNQKISGSAGKEFASSQKVQDPHTVILSTEIRPPAVRYPATFGPVNTAFVVSIPYSKNTDNGVDIGKKELNQSLAQVEYPIAHCLTAEPGTGFYSTKNILIETPDLDLSRSFAIDLMKKDWAQVWIEKKQGNIFVAKVNQAQTNFLENFKTT